MSSILQSGRCYRWVQAINKSTQILYDLIAEADNPDEILDASVATDHGDSVYMVYQLRDGSIVRDREFEIAWNESYDEELDDVYSLLDEGDIAWAYYRIIADDPTRLEFVKPLARFLDLLEWNRPENVSLKEIEYVLTVRYPLDPTRRRKAPWENGRYSRDVST